MSTLSLPPKIKKIPTDFWPALALFVSFRLCTLLLLKPGGFIRDWSDFDTYLGIAALSDYGLYPFTHFWLEWPPLIPWLMVGVYKLSLLLPVWEDQRFWFVTLLGMVLLLFEAGNFVLVYRLAYRLWNDSAVTGRILWLYAGLFPPVYTMLGYFDGVALFFILLSLDYLIANQPGRSAMAAAAGFAVKLTPILAAGVAAWHLWHTYRINPRRLVTNLLSYGLAFIATAAILFAPFRFTNPDWLAAFFRATAGRSSWETVWAVLEGYYGFGQLAGNRLNPAETVFAVHPALLPWPAISLIFGVIYAFFFFQPTDQQNPRRIIRFGGVTVTLFLLYSKGYSPQFVVYVLPFIILLLPNLTGVAYALALTLLNLAEQPLFFVMLPTAHWLLTGIVGLRFAVFAALIGEFWLKESAETVKKYLRWALAAAMLISLPVAVPAGLNDYQQTRLDQLPQKWLVQFLRTQTATADTLLFTDQPLYRQLYPFLHTDFQLKLLGGDALYATAPTAANLLTGESAVWLLASGPQGAAVESAVQAMGKPLATYSIENLGTLTLIAFNNTTQPPQPIVTSSAGISLPAFDLQKTSATSLTLTLFWHTINPVAADTTVLTQVLNAAGERVAGHDSIPAAGWLPDALIADQHIIILPDALSPGTYRIIAGLYHADGVRIPIFDAAGTPLPNDVVTVADIKF